MLKKYWSLLFMLLSVSMLTLSCGGQKSEDGSQSEEFDKAESELTDQIKDVVYDIPSPSEIPYLLEATGAEFNQALINDNNKAEQYATTNDKAALNLGVYATDIGYLSSYAKVQDALNYMQSSQKIADGLGVLGAIDPRLVSRFESNLANRDSLAYLVNDLVHSTESFLKDDNRARLAALVLTGSFLEGLYISTQLIKTYPTDILEDDERNLVLTPLIRVILEQRKSTEDLVQLLQSVDGTGDLVTDITELNRLYGELNIEEQISNNRANFVLSDKTLENITTLVAQIRGKIVS